MRAGDEPDGAHRNGGGVAGQRAVLPPPLPLPGEGTGALPPNQPGSFGTGPENPAGLQLEYQRHGDVVRTTITVAERFAGAVGIVHGGIVATLLDDVMGAVISTVGGPAVTAQLDVTFLLPVVIDRPLQVEGWLADVEGRKHRVVGRVTDDGRVVAVGRGLFVAVGPEHYERLGVPVPRDAKARTTP